MNIDTLRDELAASANAVDVPSALTAEARDAVRRRVRHQRVRERVAVGVAGVLIIAIAAFIYSNGIYSQPQTIRPATRSAPAPPTRLEGHIDLAQGASAEQIATIRSALETDPDIANISFVSGETAFETIANSRTLPAEAFLVLRSPDKSRWFQFTFPSSLDSQRESDHFALPGVYDFVVEGPAWPPRPPTPTPSPADHVSVAPPRDATAAMLTALRHQLQDDPRVKSIGFVNQETAYKQLVSLIGQYEISEFLIGPVDAPAYFMCVLHNPRDGDQFERDYVSHGDRV
jgi:hypothetical protein